MFALALRQIRADPVRSALTCAGIASVLGVMLVLQGFRAGLDEQLRRVALDRGADLIAAQAGVRNMIGARSVIPQTARGQVEAVAGVRAANPMTMMPFIYEKDGRKSAAFLLVTDSAGGPRRAEAGRLPAGEGEILIDRALARMFDLGPGDEFVVAGYAFEVVGVGRPMAALWTPFASVTYDALLEFYFEAELADDLSAFPLVSHLLVDVAPGRDAAGVAREIEAAVPDVDAYPPEVVAENDVALGRTMLGALLTLLIAVAYAAGLLVVALFMYTMADARRRDLGVLKALGFRDGALVRAIAAEALLLVALAIPLGVLIARGLAGLVYATMPIYLILPTTLGPVVSTILASVLFALIGAVGPLRLVRRLDPQAVFQT